MKIFLCRLGLSASGCSLDELAVLELGGLDGLSPALVSSTPITNCWQPPITALQTQTTNEAPVKDIDAHAFGSGAALNHRSFPIYNRATLYRTTAVFDNLSTRSSIVRSYRIAGLRSGDPGELAADEVYGGELVVAQDGDGQLLVWPDQVDGQEPGNRAAMNVRHVADRTS